MEEFYIDISGRLLANMRLTIEGAVNLYETDAAPLHRLAKANNMRAEANAFDIIGAALYSLLEDIRDFQEAYIRETMRESGGNKNT